MSTIVIKIDGVDVTKDVVITDATFVGVADGNVGSAMLTIDDRYQQYSTADFRSGMTLELLIDGTREWDGYVSAIGRAWPFDADDTSTPGSAPRYWKLRGQDRNVLWQKRVLYKQSDPTDDSGLPIWPEDTPDQTALIEILNDYVDLSGDGLSHSIQSIASPGPFEEFTLGFVSAPMGVAFEDAAKITGGVFWIGPDRVLYYKDDLTVTAPWGLSDNPTGTQRSYRELDAALDYTHAANQALVWGAGRGSPDPVFAKYTDDAAVATYGLWQWGDEYLGAWKQQTVNRRARTYVEGSPSHRRGHNDPVPSVRVTLHEPGLRVGMVVDFESEVFGYSEPLPVREVTITFPTKDSAKFEYHLTLMVDSPFGVPDLWDFNFNFPPFDWEWIPWEGVGGVDPTSGPVLIDHFESSDLYWIRSETVTTPAYTHTLDLPDGVPGGVKAGDLIWVAVNIGQTLTGAEVVTIDTGGIATTAFNFIGGATNSDEYNALFVYLVEGDEDYETTPSVVLSATDDVGEINPALIRIGYEIGVVRDHNAGLANPINPTGAFVYASVPADDVDPLVLTDFNLSTSQKHPAAAVPSPYFFHFFGTRYGSGNTIFPRVRTYTGGGGGGVLDSSFTIDYLNATATADNPAHISGTVIRDLADDQIDAYELEFEDNYPHTDDNTNRGHVVGFVMFIDEAGYWDRLLPGPEITGADPADQAGGNEWIISGPGTLYGVDNSELGVQLSWKNFDLRSPIRSIIDDDGTVTGWTLAQGDAWPPDPLVDPVRPGIDTPFDLLVKFRFEGSDTTRDGYIFINPEFISVATDGVASDISPYGDFVVSWLADPAIGIYWWVSGGLPVAHLEMYNAGFSGGTGITPDVIADPTVDDAYVSVSAPWDHYWWKPPNEGVLTENTDYYLRCEFGAEVHNAEAHSKTIRVKLWKVGDPEPTAWDIEDVMTFYKAGGANTHPSGVHTNNTGSKTNYFEEDELGLTLDGSPDGVYIDALWRYGVTGGTGGTVTDIPVFDNTTGNTESSSYLTDYPYAAGSLEVWYEGVRLQIGVDYVESDPSSGLFTLLGSPDYSSGLRVRYKRAGGLLPGGGYPYRPNGQLMYGWGTPLDGYNAIMAASAVALDRHTLGAYSAFSGTPRSTPPSHRGYQSDQSGRADLPDVLDAWSAGWGQSFWNPGVSDWASFISRINAGRGAILEGSYGSLPEAKRFSTSYSGRHAIYVNEQYANGNLWGYDPLYRYPIIYTEADLQSFAYGLAGSGLVRAGFTKVT